MNLDQHCEYSAPPRKSRRPGRREREQHRATQATVPTQASASSAERVRDHRARLAEHDAMRWRPLWLYGAQWPRWCLSLLPAQATLTRCELQELGDSLRRRNGVAKAAP